jgi:hypothetical protein
MPAAWNAWAGDRMPGGDELGNVPIKWVMKVLLLPIYL